MNYITEGYFTKCTNITTIYNDDLNKKYSQKELKNAKQPGLDKEA